MNIVIIGNGNIGKSLADILSKKGHDIVIIDSNYSKVNKVIDTFDVKAIWGNGTIYETQIKAGVAESDLTIAVTSSDETNLISSMIAKQIGSKKVIAKVNNIDYSSQIEFMKNNFNLDFIINTDKLLAYEILKMIKYPRCLKVKPIGKESLIMSELVLKKGNKLINNRISDINKKYKDNVLLYALFRENKIFIPSKDDILNEKDTVCIVGKNDKLNSFFDDIGIIENNTKSIIIVGGSNTSVYLANELSNMGIKVKIIEKDLNICKRLAQLVSRAKIINKDAKVQDVLIEEGINNTDVFISMTESDEENTIISLFASHCNVEKVITKLNDTSIINLLEFSNLNNFISPIDVISNEIEQYITQENISKNILYDNVNFLDFKASKKDKVLGIPISKLKIKSDVTIVAIFRNGNLIVPTGNDYIKINDNPIIATKNKFLKHLDDILC